MYVSVCACICVCEYSRKRGTIKHDWRGLSEVFQKPLVSGQVEPGEKGRGQGPVAQVWRAEHKKETRKPLS